MADYLNEIRSRLEKIVKESNGEYEEADYGLINSELKNFNLLVFRRAKTECSGKRGEPGQDYFKVHIIKENYIPEGAVQEVIDALEAPSADGIKFSDDGIKFKLTGDPVTYDYSSKGSSDVVIEMATVTFTRPERRY